MNSKINWEKLASELFREQIASWPLLKENHMSLEKARVKTFHFENLSFKVQFNPERIISSAAKVDKKSISERKCFLCENNRPPEQKKLVFPDNYEILCNPFPIFDQHFTISHREHIPQEIKSSFSSFLEISRALPEQAVLYNAPDCGASAPDHLHFQSGNMGFLPIEKEYKRIVYSFGNPIVASDDLNITSVDDGFRKFIIFESAIKEKLVESFQLLFGEAGRLPDGKEPMLNILSYYPGNWRVMVFLRKLHRPWQYFAGGDDNILLSPASVDMGGVLITPLEKDYMKIAHNDIKDIFQQVSVDVETFRLYEELLRKHN